MKETLTKFQTCNFRRGLVPAVLLFAAACSKDPMTEIAPAGRSLRFDVSQDDGWHTPQSRATIEDTEPTTVQVIPLQDETSSETLYLHVSVTDGIEPTVSSDEQTPKTRAAYIDDMSEYGAFAVNGFTYKGAWDSSLIPDLMNKVKVVEQGNGVWTPAAGTYHWPGAGKKVRFFAYAPTNQDNIYTDKMIYVPANGFNRDILFADSGEMDGDTDAPVPLTFKHIMSCLKFVTGDDMKAGKIANLQLRNMHAQHQFSFDTETWSVFGNSAGTHIYFLMGGDAIVTDGTAGTELLHYFIAPQRFAENTTLYVDFYDALTSTSRILTASLAGMELPMGKTVTFRLSTSSVTVEPHLNVGWMNDFPYAGGTHQYSVSSYIDVSSNGLATKHAAAAWKAEFSTDGGQTWTTEKPEWLTSFTSEAAGGYAARSYSATVAAQQHGQPFNTHNDALRVASPVNGVYDLSTDGGTATMNTANCYVVNAPGTYSLPLVYGNAIKNGIPNPSAYTSTATGSNVLKVFVNHLDEEITDPYIYNNANCTPADAALIWQDEENLVTDVVLSSDGKRLNFEVGAATIRQGNAVVAVRDDNGEIMWSWHIWVTDYKLGEDIRRVTNNTNVIYEMMPVNIGWCDATIATYDARDVKVRFVQVETGKTEEFTIVQTGYTEEIVAGNNPYYQWGRKDPMLPGLNGNIDKPYYSSDYTFVRVQGSYTFGTAIKTPFNLYLWNLTDPCPTRYYNVWNANYTGITVNDDKVVKTIYDPSPAGYHLPAPAAFTGITSDSQIATNSYGVKFNMPYASAADFESESGVDFYCNKMAGDGQYDTTGGTIHYPVSGSRPRSANGNLSSVGTAGGCWSAGSYFVDYGFHMQFSFPQQSFAHKLWPAVFALRSNALPVRSVRETE